MIVCMFLLPLSSVCLSVLNLLSRRQDLLEGGTWRRLGVVSVSSLGVQSQTYSVLYVYG